MAGNDNGGPSRQAAAHQPIEKGHRDLAQNRDYLQMRVEVDGRIPFQRVHLWSSGEERTGSGRMKTSTDQYKPETDGPAIIQCPKAPKGDELIPSPKKTKEYIEVGLIVGDNPEKHSIKGTPTKGKGKQKATVILRRDENAMRVFIPVSEKLNPQAKFFVGCRYSNGRLFPAIVPAEHVFFYAEFWQDVSGDRRNRARILSENCRKAAALDKTTETRMAASLVPSLVEKIATAHPLVVTQPEHLATKLVLTWHTFVMSGEEDDSFIDMMLAAMDNCGADLKYGPHTRTDGENAFFDFSSELTRAECDELREEVSRLNPKLRGMDPQVIMAIHNALRTDAGNAHEDTESEGEHYLGDALPRNALLFFLQSCLNLIPAGAHHEVTLREVKQILPSCQWHSENRPRTTLEKVVDNGATKAQPVTAQNFRAVLLAIKSYLEASVKHANRVIESVAGEHGALLKHENMNSLMRKLGNATDVAHATSLFEQVCSLHALQYGIASRSTAEANEEIIPLIDEILLSIESSNP